MSKGLILLTAIVFFVYGLACMIFPVEVLDLVIGGSVSSLSGLIDIRATYGGMSLGVGVILYILARKESTINTGLWGVVAVMSAMALGRGTGIYVDGSPNWVMYLYLVLEILVALASIVLLRLNRP